MKFQFLSLLLCCIATYGNGIQFQGGGSLGKDKVESLSATGVVKLNGTEVEGSLQVTGSLIAKDAEIGFLDILGEANLTDSHVKKGGTVLGLIQAVHTTFDSPITILSARAVFTNSTLKEITVKQDSSFKGKQVIELRQRTLVDGPIHFESGKGEVRLYSNSQVLGLVTGGKIIKH